MRQQCLLGSLCDFRAGSSFPQDEQGGTRGLPFIKVSDLSIGANGKFLTTANNYITAQQQARLRIRPVPSGSIVFAKIGEGLRSERFRVAIEDTAIDNNLMAAVPRSGRADPEYLYYLLSTLGISRLAHGSALPYLRQSDLEGLGCEIPSLPTQHAIARVLGALDDKIAANQKVATVSEALFSAEFTGLQRSQDAELVAVTELVEVNPRSAAPTKPDPVYVDMQKLPTSGSQIAGWSTRPAQGGARFVNGDTVMARITPCLENRKVGFVDFLEPGETAIGSTEFIVLRSRPGFAKPLSFLLAVDEGFRAHAVQHMVGSSGRQRVSASDLATYELRLPLGSDALGRLGERAESTFQLLASQRDESRHLAELRDTLLPHLMSGRLSVRDAEAQVEAVL